MLLRNAFFAGAAVLTHCKSLAAFLCVLICDRTQEHSAVAILKVAAAFFAVKKIREL